MSRFLDLSHPVFLDGDQNLQYAPGGPTPGLASPTHFASQKCFELQGGAALRWLEPKALINKAPMTISAIYSALLRVPVTNRGHLLAPERLWKVMPNLLIQSGRHVNGQARST